MSTPKLPIPSSLALKTASGDFKLPWHKPGLSLPENATTKRPYHGINVLALWLAASTRGYETNKWASYKQWQTIGGHVRKGERGCQIIFYKQYTINDEDTGYDIEGHDDGDDSKDSRQKTRFFIRASTVFNKCQVEGLKEEETQSSDFVEPLIMPQIKAEELITASGGRDWTDWHSGVLLPRQRRHHHAGTSAVQWH